MRNQQNFNIWNLSTRSLAAWLMLWVTESLAFEPAALRPSAGGEVVERQRGAKVWSDRDYTLSDWPKLFDAHSTLLRSSIKETRFEVARAGFVVVMTPASGEMSQMETLRQQGFQSVVAAPFHAYSVSSMKQGNLCTTWQKAVGAGEVVSFGYYGLAVWSDRELPVGDIPEGEPLLGIPTVDISGQKERHSFIARGTPEVYQGHVDTLLMPDHKTMFAAWSINHAGHLGPLARSDDAGLTWTDPLPVPDNWWEVRQTTPTVHRLVDPQGKVRLFVFGGCDFPGRLRQSFSEDEGKTWTPMKDTGLLAECAPKTILGFDEGKRLVMWCDRRDPDSSAKDDKDPVVWQSESLDGGLTWSPERVVVKVPTRWAQPAVERSPDGKQLIMLLRNNRAGRGLFSTSDDEGRTWTDVRDLPLALTGHRHHLRYAPDGRLVVVMRDTAGDFERLGKVNASFGHFVAWVGTYEDIIAGREGQYRIKLLHSHAGRDTGYSGFDVLPDGTFLATTYIKYAPDENKHSVVMTRFKLAETDALLSK
jgi:BNR repeat-like domain